MSRVAAAAVRLKVGLGVGLVVLLAGCGVAPSGVGDAGAAPTGVAPGVTLYFLDAQGRLRPQLRGTGRLGGVPEALALLLTGPGPDPALRTGIGARPEAPVVVTTAPGVLHLMVPLAADEVSAAGVDQLVCTALGVHVQGGGSPGTRVQVRFTLPTPESDVLRACPLTR